MKMPPAWWARSLYYYHTVATEPVGVVLAMQSTQEGQMPGLIGEVLLPAFEKHYGFKRAAPEIEFFTGLTRIPADVEPPGRRQSDLCAKYLNTPELEARALRVAQEICELRWASISELIDPKSWERKSFCRLASSEQKGCLNACSPHLSIPVAGFLPLAGAWPPLRAIEACQDE